MFSSRKKFLKDPNEAVKRLPSFFKDLTIAAKSFGKPKKSKRSKRFSNLKKK